MKVLVVGLGSIAKKHIKVLKKLIPDVEIVALRSQMNSSYSDEILNIYTWDDVPYDVDFVIISNPTSRHFDTIHTALKLRAPLFIEKPPLSELTNAQNLNKLIAKNKIKTYVAFNLRFHPVIEWLKENIQLNKVREVQIYCGSYLPEWRPNSDYRECYSAIKELGGGVHLDLIHELDYARWFFGEPIVTRAERNKKSNLEINSIDFANYLLEYSGFYVNVTLNYYRRDPKRTIEIILNDETWHADLLKCKVQNDKNKILFDFPNFKPMTIYEKQMNFFLNVVLEKENYMNNFEYSLETLKICLTGE